MSRPEPVTSISILRFEEREKPSHHVVYQVTVKGPSETWTVWKRYSDFEKFNKSLIQFFPDSKLPRPLPPKSGVLSLLGTFSTRSMSPEQLQDRKEGLEHYLQGILYAKDTRLRHSSLFQDFLEVPQARRNSHAIAETSKDTLLSTLQASVQRLTTTATGSTQQPSPSASKDQQYKATTGLEPITSGFIGNTSEGWLTEIENIQQVLQQIRTAINGREYCAERNDVTGLQSLNVQIRKAMAAVTTRIEKLEKALGSLNLTAGEKSRRSNLVFAAKQELESIAERFSVPVSRGPRIADDSQNRKDLFSRPSSQGNPDPSSSSSASGSRSGGSGRSGRKFGRGGGPPVETEETRPLDNRGLLQLQNATMQQQDEALDALSSIIRRQKEIGLTMNHELDLQNQMLNDLDTDVTRVEDHLKIADKKLGRILKG